MQTVVSAVTLTHAAAGVAVHIQAILIAPTLHAREPACAILERHARQAAMNAVAHVQEHKGSIDAMARATVTDSGNGQMQYLAIPSLALAAAARTHAKQTVELLFHAMVMFLGNRAIVELDVHATIPAIV